MPADLPEEAVVDGRSVPTGPGITVDEAAIKPSECVDSRSAP